MIVFFFFFKFPGLLVSLAWTILVVVQSGRRKGGERVWRLLVFSAVGFPYVKGIWVRRLRGPAPNWCKQRGGLRVFFFGAECWQHQRAAGTASDRVQVACTE